MGKKPGRRSQSRSPRCASTAASPAVPAPSQADEDMAAVKETMRHQNFVLMAADAELEPVEEADRRDALAGVAGLRRGTGTVPAVLASRSRSDDRLVGKASTN